MKICEYDICTFKQDEKLNICCHECEKRHFCNAKCEFYDLDDCVYSKEEIPSNESIKSINFKKCWFKLKEFLSGYTIDISFKELNYILEEMQRIENEQNK